MNLDWDRNTHTLNRGRGFFRRVGKVVRRISCLIFESGERVRNLRPSARVSVTLGGVRFSPLSCASPSEKCGARVASRCRICIFLLPGAVDFSRFATADYCILYSFVALRGAACCSSRIITIRGSVLFLLWLIYTERRENESVEKRGAQISFLYSSETSFLGNHSFLY